MTMEHARVVQDPLDLLPPEPKADLLEHHHGWWWFYPMKPATCQFKFRFRFSQPSGAHPTKE